VREEEQRLSTLDNTAPVMIWSAGPDNLCDYFNERWLTYRGRTLQQEAGSGWLQGVYPEDAAHCQRVRNSSFDQHHSFQIEYRLRRHDHTYRWILDSGVPSISTSGTFLGFVGTCVDIQDLKVTEQCLRDENKALHRHNEELQEFACAASHDLQEPLRTIASYTQLLAKRYDSPHDTQSGEFVRNTIAGIRRMQTLIEGLLDYSRVHQAGMTIVDVDCNTALQQVLFGCQAAIQESGTVITYGLLPVVQADQEQLIHVLQNLISNAVKYRHPEKPPRVHISVDTRLKEWCFQVSDNGIGFDRQYSERIFGAFKRLHGHGEYSGSGIGLAICKKIVERHGGRIWAESEPGYGSQFFFTIARA
jgi:PAS domain S-box-containing protein